MTLGHHVKHGLKWAARGLSVVGEIRGQDRVCSRILTYHSVGKRDHEMNVGLDDFRDQMEWLADQGIVRTLSDAAEGAEGVAITFDDGYADTLRIAAPVLAELGLSATVFIVAGRAGMRLTCDADLETGALMTWEEIREIETMGWSVGGHTLTHRRLSRLTRMEQRTEIADCTRLLEDNLGHTIEAFAYPYGSALDYNETSKELVRASGYSFAVSNRFGPNTPGCDRWALRRMWIDRTDTLDSFCAKVEGHLDGMVWLDSPLGIRARRALNGLLKTG